jgi:MFS family permease
MGSITSVPSYLKTIGLTTSTSGERLLIGFIGALYFVGVMLGALISGWLSDKVGRRRALICASVWGCIIVPIFAASQNLGWVISTRILNGVATGAFDSIGLNWCAETVSHKKRGRSIGFQLCSAAVGASSCYFIIYGMIKQHTGEIVWRFPMAFQLVCFVSVLILVPLLPESPRWLVKVGMHNEAQLVLIAMAHDNVPSNEDAQAAQRAAALEVATIAAALEEERAEKSSASYFSMFLKRDRMHTLRRTWSAFFIQFATQAFLATGYLAGYGIVIFETSGWSSDTAALLAGMVILTQAVCGLGGAFLADRLGRRVAMMTGTLSGAVFLSLLGMCAYFVAEYAESDPGRAKAFGNGALVLTLLWGAQYGLTFCESSVSTMNTTLGTNKSCSVVFIHLSFRDLPSPVSSQRQLCWHRWIRYRFVPGKHGQHIYIQCYRLGDDVFTLRDKLHGRCNLLLFYAGNS